MTYWLLSWMILFLGLAGLAIDTTNAYRNRAMLQITGDIAAHAGAAAIIEGRTLSEIRSAAVEVAGFNFGFADKPNPVEAASVEVGRYDTANGFVAGAVPFDAVRVSASLEKAGGNPLFTSMLGILGVDSFDVRTRSLAVVARPPCPGAAIVTRRGLSIAAATTVGGSTCLHGEDWVRLPGDVALAPDVRLSMPDTRLVDEGGDLWVTDGSAAPFQAQAVPGSLIPLAARADKLAARIAALGTWIREGTHPWTEEMTLAEAEATVATHGPEAVDVVALTETNGAGESVAVTDAFGEALYAVTYPRANADHLVTVDDVASFDLEQSLIEGNLYFALDCTAAGGGARGALSIDSGAAGFVPLAGGEVYEIPAFATLGEIADVVIVSRGCAVHSASTSPPLRDVVIAVDKPEDLAAVSLSAGALPVTGVGDCAQAGGLVALSTGGLSLDARAPHARVELVATGPIDFDPAATTYDAQVQGWRAVTLGGTTSFAACPGDDGYTVGFAPYPRLVGG